MKSVKKTILQFFHPLSYEMKQFLLDRSHYFMIMKECTCIKENQKIISMSTKKKSL